MILLDTHVVAWAADDPKRLSRDATSAIRRARRSAGLAVSAITLWELAQLVARGRVQVYGSVETSVRALIQDMTVIPITPEIAALATEFPDDYPHDPVDRIIGATARAEGMTLVTRDERIRRSPLIRTVW
ncbi:MAG: type II toxin-antitoxin system VapC family toxin [Terriglobales bacterium]